MKKTSTFEQQIIKHLVAKSRHRQPFELVNIISMMFTEGKIVFDARDPNKPPLSYFRDKENTDTLIECLNSLVYVNPSLIDLVDNDLKFTED